MNTNNAQNHQQQQQQQQQHYPMREFANAIIPDLPLLMYGSGDVGPPPTSTSQANNNNNVDVQTTSLLADLVSIYVHDLVNAAVDSHDVMTDGKAGILPPPCFTTKQQQREQQQQQQQQEEQRQKSRKKRGVPDTTTDTNSKQEVEYNKTNGDNDDDDDCCWDQPLPKPIIKKQKISTSATTITPANNHHPTASSVNNNNNNNNNNNEDECINPYDWRGVEGIDIFSNRIRKNYVSTPSTIGPRSFLNPIKHDEQLLDRVNVLLNTRKEISDALLDTNGMMSCIREESDLILADQVFGFLDPDGAIGPSVDGLATGSTNGGKDGNGSVSKVMMMLGVGSGGDSSSKATNTKAAASATTTKTNASGTSNNAEDNAKAEAMKEELEEKKLNLAKRIGLEPQWPGLEDLFPTHGSHSSIQE